jgi:hypothetical protein
MMIIVLSQAAIIKYHELGGLANTILFLTVLETGKSKIKVLANSVLSKDSLHGLQASIFSLCPLMAERGGKKSRERETKIKTILT